MTGISTVAEIQMANDCSNIEGKVECAEKLMRTRCRGVFQLDVDFDLIKIEDLRNR